MAEVTEVYKAIVANIDKVNCVRGGARSSKTHSLLQIFIRWLRYGKIGIHEIPSGTAIIARETFPALRRTVLPEFTDLLEEYGLMNKIIWKRAVHEFIFIDPITKDKRKIVFQSLDDPSKVQGYACDLFWINEANPVNYKIFEQLLIRCRYFCFLDYNPFDDSWIKNKIEQDRMRILKDVSLTVSTYHNNPFLPDSIRIEIESLKFTDPDSYEIFARGNWVTNKGLVYSSFKIVDELPAVFEKEYAGLDFGYQNDPSALVQIRQKGKELFLKEHLYQSGMLNSTIAEYIHSHLFGIKVIADSAEMKSIAELKRSKVRVFPAWKGKDSILQGIQFVKQHKIFVTKDSINLIRELEKYKYMKKDDIFTNVPEDKNNHLLDAMRYAVQYYSKVNKIKIW